MTYIYVKKDLTFIADPAAQTLVKAFLTALYTDEYITQCEEEFGFVRVDGALRDQALSEINALVTSDGAPEWTFEIETEPSIGQGDYVISWKRESYSEVEQADMVDAIAALQAEIAILQEQNAMMMEQLGHTNGGDEIQEGGVLALINDAATEDTQVKAALVMSSISMVFWILVIIAMLARAVTGGRQTPLEISETAKVDGEVH
jgi:hypothetical protein